MRSGTLNFADWVEAIFWRSFWHIFWHSFCHIFWHIFWHSFWHIFWHSFWHIFWNSFWHIFWHSFWHSFWHIFWQSFWHIFWHALTYLLTFLLTHQRQNIASTASHKSHSTNSIFTLHHAAKVISMTTLCLSNGNSTVAFGCIGQPRQEAVESKDAKRL